LASGICFISWASRKATACLCEVILVDLKELLINLRGEDIDVLSVDEMLGLAYEMLEQIGTTDAELRDALIYPALADIIASNLLPRDSYIDIVQTCLDERHLFYKLGEQDGDGVFMRSFSVSILAELIKADATQRFLSPADFEDLLGKIIWYISGEADVRGFVAQKGWAHAIAHAADALTCLVTHPLFDEGKFAPILDVIENCLFKKGILADDEDTRLVFAVRALMARGLDDADVTKWIFAMVDKVVAAYDEDGYTRHNYKKIRNMSNFLKSYYFAQKFDGGGMSLRVVLADKTKELHRLQYKS